MKLEEVRNLHKITTTSVGVLPYTNYFDVEGGYKKEISKWKYSYQENFSFDEALKTKGNIFVTTPYCGALHGFGKPVYSNDRYLFPYEPPIVLGENSAQIFIHNEKIDLDDSEYILQIEGIDNCYYLFINNLFVGFSNISHTVSKFNIKKYLKNGINEIRIIVLRFSPSSYLEDQDKIRLSGIFRRIFLIKRKPNYLKNYVIRTECDSEEATINIKLEKESKVCLSGFGEKQELIGKNLVFKVLKPFLWNAEEPNLYKLDIYCNGEHIIDYVGIRKISVIGNKLYLNNKLFKMKGVNRHSFTTNGYAESYEQMEEDIKILKKNNVNAVRTSHYPADPYFYHLCDKYGIYVMSEADLETHGTLKQFKGYDKELWPEIIGMDQYFDQILERELSNVIINQNHPSVVMFSLGNESGFCDVIDKLGNEIKKIDDRPLHYEGSFDKTNRDRYFKENVLGVYSRMYPSIEYCNDEAPLLDKPFVLCEFDHAMGNSLGELIDYSNALFNHEEICGAFIWEMLNQYIVRDKKECYGGDFGELIHDGDFCVDGLFTLDRIATPEVNEVKECFSPMRVYEKEGSIYIQNRYDFISFKNFVVIVEYLKNGIVYKTNEINTSLEAGASQKIDVKLNKSDYDFYSFNIRLVDNNHEEISCKSICQKPLKSPVIPADFSRKTNFILDTNGMISNISIGNKNILSNMKFNLNRAYISNDKMFVSDYEGLHMSEADFYAASIKETKEGYEAEGYIGVPSLRPFYKTKLQYKIINNELLISIHADKLNYKDDRFTGPLRFGLKFELPSNYGDIEYLGYSGESYSDRHEGNKFGLFRTNIDSNYRYIVPQNSNDHFNSLFIKLIKDNVFISANKPFSFCYDCFDVKDYKLHRCDMKNTKRRYLFIDYKMRGVGSTSCGPVVNEKHQVTDKTIDIEFVIKPII